MVICDFICRSFSHEQVNSGFIALHSKAFPSSKLMCYTSKSHSQALKFLLSNNNLENCFFNNNILIPRTSGFRSIIFYLYNFYIIGKENEVDSIFLLSYNWRILYALEIAKTFRFLDKNIKVLAVMHGAVEELFNPTPPKAKNHFPLTFKKLVTLILFSLSNIFKFSLLELFVNKNRMELASLRSNKIIFISISGHINSNLKKIQSSVSPLIITYPYKVIDEPGIIPTSKPILFGIVGYGSLSFLEKLSSSISCQNRSLVNKLSIYLIGTQYRGLSNSYSFIRPCSDNQYMNREEMNKAIKKLDLILLYHDSTKYKFSCSASIFEAISMAKPVIHLPNDCFDYYNTKENPIGFRCNNIEEMSIVILDILSGRHAKELEIYKKNIARLNKKLSMENNLIQLKGAYEH